MGDVMAQDPSNAIRNKPLRLTLSGHERQFIDDGWARAVRSVKFLTVLLLTSAAGLVMSYTLAQFFSHWAVVSVAAVVGFVAALKLGLAVAELLKFHGYRKDHELFLKQHRRKP